MNEKVKVYLPELNCPYCHDDIGVGNLSISCACGAVHHSECVDDMGGGNTCGSCNYVFNSPEAIQLGVEHFKKPESLDALVDVELKEPSRVAAYSKAVFYTGFDVALFPLKKVYNASAYVVKSWAIIHFGVEKSEDDYLAGASILDMVIGAGLGYYFVNSPVLGIIIGGSLGAMAGFGLGLVQQMGFNEYIRDSVYSFSNHVRSNFKKNLDEASKDE